MKRNSIIVIAALTLALLVYANTRTHHAKSKTSAPQPPTATQLDRTVATQDRINRYFQRDVISKLRDCWKGVQGEGEIEMKFTYARAGAGWRSERVERSSSTLPGGQDAVALRCMQEAVRGTSFPVEQGDSAGRGAVAANKFVLHWNWPVPLPANAAEFAAKKAGGGKTGGCDGRGTAAKCYTCDDDYQCIKVCVGHANCTTGPNGCGASDACASGGPFGGSGGVIIF